MMVIIIIIIMIIFHLQIFTIIITIAFSYTSLCTTNLSVTDCKQNIQSIFPLEAAPE